MRVNKENKIEKNIASKLGITIKDLKRTKEFSDIPSVMSELAFKERITIREVFEYGIYPDLSKLRVKSFKKLISLLIYLKDILKQEYSNDKGDALINRLRDLNPADVINESDILEVLGVSRRTFYDYINTLQMILDYSNY